MRTRRRCWARMFSELSRETARPDASGGGAASSSAITILRRRCRRGSKKFISTCCASCTSARGRNQFASRAAWRSIAWRTEKYLKRTPFEKVYVQPAAGDAGLAVGAAFYVHHQILGQPRKFVMEHAYWGPGFSEAQMRAAIEAAAWRERRLSGSRAFRRRHWQKKPRSELPDGKIVGWFQGRAEWGPRALGNRSILVDPRRAEMKDILNERIKHREMFRPFAPSILEEATGEYFDAQRTLRRS